jgi:tetratricopeptide (TPR) repeat protein
MVRTYFFLFLILFFLGACASRIKDQMKEYRDSYGALDFEKASTLLETSDLKNDKKSILLWHLEKGSLSLSIGNEDEAITHFEIALGLVEKLFTTKLSSKASSFLVNDASDEFYGASYERSYAHYYLAKCRYARFLKKGDKLDLQGARAAILAWDSYFSELQRSAGAKTLYSTDLMLKVFGGQIHEVSEMRNDKQIALQLYKDAYKILSTQGGIFSLFNKKNIDFIKSFEAEGKLSLELYQPTPLQEDLKKFLQFKILSITREIRNGDFDKQVKELNPDSDIQKKASLGPGNVVLVFEEGLIPQKIAKPFNFGIKGAMNSVDDSGAKAFIATVGTEFVTAFAMNKLGMVPERAASPGSFIFAHDVTKLAVQEAAIEFELPMIEEVPIVQRLELFVLDENGVIVQRGPLPVVSENGDIARVVLEEDVVARYVKTGTRVALKHIVAIIASIKVYQSFMKGNDDSGDFLAKAAAMATYVGATKGIGALEKADTRHWTTLPQALRISELNLSPGHYKIGIGIYSGAKAPEAPSKIAGDFVVKSSGKSIFTFRLP